MVGDREDYGPATIRGEGQARKPECPLSLEQVRQAMDRVGDATGKHVAVTACSLATEVENLYFGLDLPLWIEKGLVDYLAPMGDVHGYPDVDLRYYADLVKGTNCRLYPVLSTHPRYKTLAECTKNAYLYYSCGTDGLSIWDCQHGGSLWGPALRRLGHLDEINPQCPEMEPKAVPLTKIGILDLTDGHVPADYKRIGKLWSIHYSWHAH